MENINPGIIVIFILLTLISGLTTSILASLLEKHFETRLGKWPRLSIFALLALVLASTYFAYVLQPMPSQEPDAMAKLGTIEAQQATIIANFTSQIENELGEGTPDFKATEAIQEFIELDVTRMAILTALPNSTQPVIPTPLSTSALGFPSGPSLSSTFLREADGMKMLYAPGGTYLMGATEGDPNAEAFEIPQHRVTINGFWLDETEVTSVQYAQFLNAIIPDTTQLPTWIEVDSEDSLIRFINGHYEVDESASDNPVNKVSWFGADAYCKWVGGRLPTEEEWEYAARGSSSLIYPWGNNFDGSFLNFCDVNCPRDWRNITYNDGYSMTASVGSFPSGESWMGASDLAGNVAEWTANGLYAYSANENWSGSGFTSITTDAEQGFHKVVRGGSWANTSKWTRTTYRAFPAPEEKSEFIGFRCAASP